jgi:putative DNA methylase
MAVILATGRGRVYCSPTADQEHLARSAKANWGPEELVTTPSHDVDRLPMYGMPRWRDAFMPRQLLALTTFCELVPEAREKVFVEAARGGFRNEQTRLHAGGSEAAAYADAIATYLGLAIGRAADYWSTIATWVPTGEFIRNTFARQAIAMSWDFVEANPFSGASGNWEATALEWVAKALLSGAATTGGSISQVIAQANNYPVGPTVISTDPPYYDNIGYADLSDYFYVWHRHALSSVWPDLYRRLTTPKTEELIASPSRHGGRENAEEFFLNGMRLALAAMKRAARDDEPLAIYYAFKQSEEGEDGVTSAGWASFLQAVVDTDLSLDGTWPIRTERTARTVGIAANTLASSIVLVCRKRGGDASIVTRSEFIRALKRELPDAIDDIRNAGVGPVDMQQSVIGPGMGIFTRYAKVLEDDDSAMSVRTALGLINRVWEEIENELEANFDAETQVALAWFATYGFDAKPSGELITLANAKNISLNALFSCKVFQDHHGKAGLSPRDKLPRDWEPTDNMSLTVWECLQHIIRVLKAEDGGAQAAGRIIAQIGSKAAEARLLAERLYQIAAQKGWQQEALVYNEVAEEWPTLEEFAQNIATEAAEPLQARLL